MGSSAVELVAPIVSMVQGLQPASVLDIGVGFGKWGFLLREYLEIWKDRAKKDEWTVRVDGVEIFPEYHDVIQPYLYDTIHYGDVREFSPERRYDLALACDVIEHLPKEDGAALVEHLGEWAENVVLSVPMGKEWLRSAYGKNPYEQHMASWESGDFDESWERLLVSVPGGRQIGIFVKGGGFRQEAAADRLKRAMASAGLAGTAKAAMARLKEIQRSRSYRLACRMAQLASPLRAALGRKRPPLPKTPDKPERATAAAVARKSHPTERLIPEERLRGLPKALRHMARCDPRFELIGAKRQAGRCEIMWEGQRVGTTLAVEEVRDSREGDAFLVGTGPSVGEIDFSILRGRSCFGTNGAVAKFKEAGFSPEYYAITTYDFFHGRFEMVREVLGCGAKCFFPFWGLSVLCEREPELLRDAAIYLVDPLNQRYRVPRIEPDVLDLWVDVEPSFVGHDNVRRRDDKVGFSRDIGLGYFHGENILYTALQIAYYIGFRRLFLLGMDLNYSGPKPRFYESAQDSRPTWIDESFERSVVPCFEIVSKLVGQGELAVYNVSPNSRLPGSIIPKISVQQMVEMI